MNKKLSNIINKTKNGIENKFKIVKENRKVKLVIGVGIAIIVLASGVTYAVINNKDTGNKEVVSLDSIKEDEIKADDLIVSEGENGALVVKDTEGNVVAEGEDVSKVVEKMKEEGKTIINQTTENKVAEPSNNSNIQNNSTSSSDTNNNNNSSKPSKNEDSNHTHTHSWVEQYKDVYHDEEGHYEDVIVKQAWTESSPIYEEQYRAICNTCGADITNSYIQHSKNHMLNGENGSYRNEPVNVQVGTNTINHPAVTEKKWIVDKQAWTEKVLTGYKCSSCGETK